MLILMRISSPASAEVSSFQALLKPIAEDRIANMWPFWSKWVASRQIAFLEKQQTMIKSHFFHYQILLQMGTEKCF